MVICFNCEGNNLKIVSVTNPKIKKGGYRMDNPKIYYCIAGGVQIVVPKDNIIVRDGFSIHASRAYFVVPQQSEISGVGGKLVITFGFTVFQDTFLQCNFISDLSEEEQLYKDLVKFLGKERR